MTSRCPSRNHQAGRGYVCSARPEKDYLCIFQLAIRKIQGIVESGKSHSRSALLIVVPNGYGQFLSKRVQDLKTFWRGNVFEMNCPKCWFEIGGQFDYLFGIVSADRNWDCVN